jgi:hypothetical protein
VSGVGDATVRHPSALRRVVGELTRFDTSAFAPFAGLRVATAVVAALCIGLGAGNGGAAASLASGALLVGLSAVVAGRRAPVRGLLAIAVTMGATTFVGSATGRLGWVHTGVLAVVCLAGGLMMALGQTATSVGTQGMAAMIVFGRFAEPPLGALHLAAYVVAGGALAVLVVGVTRAPLTAKVQRQALAAGYRGLAGIARSYQVSPPTGAAAEAFDAAEALLARRLDPGPAGGENLRALLDVGRRARLELLAIDGLRRRLPDQPDQAHQPGTSRAEAAGEPGEPGPGGPRADLEAALGSAGDALDAVAQSLVTGGPAGAALTVAGEASQAARARIRERYQTGAPTGPPTGQVQVAAAAGEHLAALAGQIRAAADLAGGWSGASFDLRAMLPGADARPRRPAFRQRARDVFDALSDHATLRSPIGRHAVRLAVAVAVAEAIALHSPLARGYWVALTVAVVLRPDFSVTFSRGAARMAGTSVGVLLAGLLAVAVRPSGAAGVVAAGLLCAAACASFQVSYLAFSALITGLVVMLVGFVSPGTVTTAFDRLVDTLIGGSLALVAYAVWPTWSAGTAHEAFAALARAQRDYLDEVLAVVTGRRTLDPQRLRSLAKRARRVRADAESVVDRSLAEPAARRIDVAWSRGILAAMRRVSLTCHALRTDLEAGRLPTPFPQAIELSEGLVGTLGTVAARLAAEPLGAGGAWHVREHLPSLPSLPSLPVWRHGHDDDGPDPEQASAAPPEPFRLRELHERLDSVLVAVPGGTALAAETDELVDAIDTLRDGFGLFDTVPEQGRDAGSDARLD